MSSEGKIKVTLAKKLTGKRVSKNVEPIVGQADNKSQFFKEIKNKEKPNKITKNKEKQVADKLGNIKKFDAIKIELKESDNIHKDTNKTAIKHYTRKLKTEPVDDIKSSVEIIKQETLKAHKNSNKNKIPPKEDEPGSSKKVKQELFEEQWTPANWGPMLENIRVMRSNDKAPVDTMGCHKCADENADEKTQRFHKLVALMLSSQTKDETTYHAMLRLREHNLTPVAISNMKTNVLENILHPVSFYKNKAKYMQQTSRILIEKYDSDIPNNIKELIALPGVGPKMAHICMATAWNEVTGIGVDVHVHRISNRMGWVPKPTKEPEQTRVALEAWLPQHLWSEVNHLLVGFGQTICTPTKAKCNECLNCEICPGAMKAIKKKTKIYFNNIIRYAFTHTQLFSESGLYMVPIVNYDL